jgi:light-regulated signal transduction histidine kinase (bacteriophytochrome)
VFDSGETLHVEEMFEWPHGILYLDTFKIPLKQPNGEVYALIRSSRDITELVMARRSLTEQARQLESTNHELESFSYSVSHDLRSPLRHINGFVAALGQQLLVMGVLDDPKINHYLRVIEDSGKKMGLLIDGLLTLSRIGRRPLERQSVNLETLVQQAIRLAKTNLETDSHINLLIRPMPTVQGDAALLQQVFTNLIDNAVKFSRDRNPAEIEIGTLPDDIFFIRDNGVGFQMAYADQLFGAFQRLHSSTEFEGTGIGLAIVQRIIHRHGGRIWVESQPDQGTCFYFRLTPGAEEVPQ